MAQAQALTTTPAPMAQMVQAVGPKAIRQIVLIVSMAAAVAAGAWIYFSLLDEPAMRPVYGNLSQQDAAQVLDALTAANIQAELDPSTGNVMVPAGSVHQARLRLASQGLPAGGGVGFELLQQDQGFGTSQFMENARFQRALETELARTIGAMQAVESARVHLGIPKQTVFVRDQAPAKASVLVNLFGGRDLSETQISAIVHLVSSSVPGLTADNVSVVDQRGNLLSEKLGDDQNMQSGDQMQYKRALEASYAERIRNLLIPIVGGEDKVRAEVNARLNFAYEESTEERYSPDNSAVLSEQTVEERNARGGFAEGVPGALTNQPPGGGTLNPELDGEEAADQPVQLSRSEVRNYEVGKTIRHTRRPMGEVERLSVAVLVDQPVVVDDDGNETREPLDQARIAQITNLIREAVGFDEARGDTINVIDAPFQDIPEQTVPPISTPLTDQPWFWPSVRYGIAALLGLLLIFMVIRPVSRAMMHGVASRPGSRAPAGGQMEQEQLEGGEQTPQLTGPGGQRQGTPTMESDRQKNMLEAAKQVAGDEPALAANVMKNWLSRDE